MKQLLFTTLMIMTHLYAFGQCADAANIYSFEYGGHTYEVVKENKTWTDAVVCATSRGGYLAEINEEAEQDAIFAELTENAAIVTTNTENQFGTASVWLGGSDAGAEGNWIWDGNNDGMGPQFWLGGPNGSPVGGMYSNWGISPAEPDDSGGQDHLTIIIRPAATNFGLWNDLVSTNSIYYLIEYNEFVSTEEAKFGESINIHPNPFTNFVTIENDGSLAIERIVVANLLGQTIKTIPANRMSNPRIDMVDLESGMYILLMHLEDGELISRKVMKQ